jgi:hypothetical protein
MRQSKPPRKSVLTGSFSIGQDAHSVIAVFSMIAVSHDDLRTAANIPTQRIQPLVRAPFRSSMTEPNRTRPARRSAWPLFLSLLLALPINPLAQEPTLTSVTPATSDTRFYRVQSP